LEKYFYIKAAGLYSAQKAGSRITINGIGETSKHDYYAIYIGRKKHV